MCSVADVARPQLGGGSSLLALALERSMAHMWERTSVGGPRVRDAVAPLLSMARLLSAAPLLSMALVAAAAFGCSQVSGIDSGQYYLDEREPAAGGAAGSADGSGAAGSGSLAGAAGGIRMTTPTPNLVEPEGDAAGAYSTREMSITVAGVQRSFLVARPRSVADGVELPVVFSFHGHVDTLESTAESIRAALPLEDEAAGAATFVYPRAPGVAWPFTRDEQRANEAQVLIAMIDDVGATFGIDRRRVFLVGWDGGAFLVNSVACRLPAGIVRGVAIHSGTLYSVSTASGPDFDETPSGRTTCQLPSALLIWGTSDVKVDYAMQGMLTHDYYVGTLQCAKTTSPWAPAAPCVTYDSCAAPLVWCAIPGLGHSIWPGAAASIWRFIDDQR